MSRLYTIIFLLIFSTASHAENAESLPLLKDGRWKTLVTPVGPSASLLGKTEVIFCTDKANQPRLVKMALAKGHCGDLSVRGIKETFQAETTCDIGGQPAQIISTLNMIDENTIKANSRIKSQIMEVSAVHNASFQGPCKPGEKPGSYKYSVQEQPLSMPDLGGLQDMIQKLGNNR